jgi:hypothetical protein
LYHHQLRHFLGVPPDLGMFGDSDRGIVSVGRHCRLREETDVLVAYRPKSFGAWSHFRLIKVESSF